MGRRSAPRLAKLTRPRLHAAVTRERLFRLLDESRQRACVWVSGPPGSGKTTLVASYASACKAPTLWYQIDTGDNDSATFFYYLRQAVIARSPRQAKKLPLFTPEYRGDLPGFARRFFRGAFSALDQNALLIFDNYHEFAEDSGLHGAFAACLEEVPEGTNIVVISRAEPPSPFARALINNSIARIDWEQLRLTRSETTAVARTRGISSERAIQAIHEQSNGWMAGLVLMSERLLHSGDLRIISRAETLETVFDYFAGQILETVPHECRDVLIRTALLPRVTAATAEVVTNVTNAIGYVEKMYQRRLFTDRTEGTPISYQYHALFRTFLLTCTKALLSDQERDRLLTRAAAESEKSGDIESAFALFVEGNDWREAERMFVTHANVLIGQGRWKTLQEWHATLSAETNIADPWVSFWLGRAMTAVDPPSARRTLESAFEAFCARSEERGQLLAGVGILEALYYQYDEEFRAMDRRIERTASHLERSIAFANPEEELWVKSVFLVACSYRLPGHAMLKQCASRVEQLLPLPLDVNLKISAATMLHSWGCIACDAYATRLATCEARPLLGSDQLTAQRAALYLGDEGYSHYINGRYPDALACFDEANVITQRDGLPDVEGRIALWRGFCQRRAGLLDEAEATVRQLQQLPIPRIGIRAVLLDVLLAYVTFDRGNLDHALELALPCEQIVEKIGQMQSLILVRIINGQMLVAAGRFGLAAHTLDLASRQIEGTAQAHQRAAITLMRAWLAFREGSEARCEQLVRKLLLFSEGERERTCIGWYPVVLAEVLAFALDRDIETEHARQLIRHFRLATPIPISDRWPWPVKIYTLGRFEILLNDKPPEYSRKSPKRVLTLLKALIAFGGNDVSEDRLADAFWPELDGDAAHKALSALVHRLRSMLGEADVVRQRGGRLSLNAEKCWVDVLHLERLLSLAGPSGVKGAIGLYRGAFLADDEDASWAVAMREKMRVRIIDALGRFASSLEESGSYQEAAEYYLRGIEVDDLVEPFYQGLMRCYDRLDRRAEAAEIYRRLRVALSIRLGSTPASATERLYQSLRAG